MGSFRHLWKSGEDLLFGVVDVFQGLVKKVFKHLLFFGHGRLLDILPVRRSNAAPRREVPMLLRARWPVLDLMVADFTELCATDDGLAPFGAELLNCQHQ